MAVSSLGFFLLCMALFISASGSTRNFTSLSFDDGFSKLYGNPNVVVLDKDRKSVQISLDRSTGSGFISQHPYQYAMFSAAIKLPAGYTAGVVVTFYTSNSKNYMYNHDELDFEFLGNINGRDWIVQTNLYGNESVTRGREERYTLWFDPTENFHVYSILWTKNCTIFYVDDVPIREVPKLEAMGGDYPSKPMFLYATIWDGSDWATNGGKHKVNYKYAPFIAIYSDLVLDGCVLNSIQQSKCDNATSLVTNFGGLKPDERTKMKNFRDKYLKYSYCYHRSRYPTPLPECVVDPQEAMQLKSVDPIVFGAAGRPCLKSASIFLISVFSSLIIYQF